MFADTPDSANKIKFVDENGNEVNLSVYSKGLTKEQGAHAPDGSFYCSIDNV